MNITPTIPRPMPFFIILHSPLGIIQVQTRDDPDHIVTIDDCPG